MKTREGGCFDFGPRWCLIRVRFKDGRGEAEVSQWTLGAGGVHKGLFHIPEGMVVRGGMQSILRLGAQF